MRKFDTIYKRIVSADHRLSRGEVWCTVCGHHQHVDSVECMRSGWPKHCGYTMTIDSPQERAAMSKAREALQPKPQAK